MSSLVKGAFKAVWVVVTVRVMVQVVMPVDVIWQLGCVVFRIASNYPHHYGMQEVMRTEGVVTPGHPITQFGWW